MTDIKIVTITTQAYQLITHNLLLSLQKLKLEDQLQIYCLDEGSYQYFKYKNAHSSTFHFENNLNDLHSLKRWGTSGFADTTFYKFYVTHSLLCEEHNVLLVDGDVVFLKDPLDYLRTEMTGYDILIQNEGHVACTGFFLVQSNDVTKEQFSPSRLAEYREKNLSGDDQVIFELFMQEHLITKFLPRDKFPNGNYFYNNHKEIDPYVIHFNCVMGEHKISTLKQYGMFFCKDEE